MIESNYVYETPRCQAQFKAGENYLVLPKRAKTDGFSTAAARERKIWTTISAI